MRVKQEIIKEPFDIEVLYASETIAVILVEGVVYVKNNGEHMTPVFITSDGDVNYMTAENIRKMGVQEYESFDRALVRHIMPDEQFDDALEQAIPRLPDDSNDTRGKEYYDIWEILYNTFENDLDVAQKAAHTYLLQCEKMMFYEEVHRLHEGEFTRDEFIEWFSDRVEILEAEDIADLIDKECEDDKQNDDCVGTQGDVETCAGA